jgi:Methyltransferase domain
MAVIGPDLAERILRETKPSFQLTDLASLNLGFGWLYYGFIRALRPRHVLVIGSKRGFSPICMALAAVHNQGHTISGIACYQTGLESGEPGHVTFVDPSKSSSRADNDHSYGEGFWDDRVETDLWFQSFGCKVTHHCVDSDSFFAETERQFNVILLDGSHTYDQSKRDIANARRSLSRGGMILMHDVHREVSTLDPMFGSHRAFEEFTDPDMSRLIIPVFPGLGIICDRCEPLVHIDPR